MSRNLQHFKDKQLLLPADAKLIGFMRRGMLIILSDPLTRKLLAITILLVLDRYFGFQRKVCCCGGSGN